MSIDIHSAATPNGWKISIMIEELREAGIDLPETNFHLISLMDGDQFTDDFTAMNPNQKVPVLVHDGRAVMESCAILQYLGETFPTALLPLDERRWDVVPWLYWQAANLGPVFGNKLSYTRYITDATDAQKSHPLERFEKEAQRLLGVLDRQLQQHPFICGADFTVADIAVFPWVRAWKWAKIDITSRPRIGDWLERVRARPGVGRGVAWGVPADEVDSFSQERRAQYRKSGGSIASNNRLKTDI
ncbi:glutathione S-transferase family protein [Minwuia sp.]|uniref:glutathione S-transferase family protein n=1 Tax=Minwuia sp. TaxID=2493630 RepID=UPI003A92DA2A